jgi:hypothetical protein
MAESRAGTVHVEKTYILNDHAMLLLYIFYFSYSNYRNQCSQDGNKANP